MTTELLTILEFCEMANISKTNAYTQINSGKLPAVKVGNKTMIRLSDAKAWIDDLPPYVPSKTSAIAKVPLVLHETSGSKSAI